MCKKCVICEPNNCNDDDNEHLCSECSNGLNDHPSDNSVGKAIVLTIIIIIWSISMVLLLTH